MTSAPLTQTIAANLHAAVLDRRAGRISTDANATPAAAKDTPILMLHGWGSSLDSMVQLADLLSAYRSVHLLDLPGFGQSPKHDGTWGTEEYADCVLEYMQRAHLSRAVVVGHSFGGRVAVRLAAKAPALVESLVLVAAAGLPPIGWTKVRRDVKRFMNRFLKARFASTDYQRASPELRRTLVKAVNEDLGPLAAKVAQPVLLVYGVEDQETPPAIGRRYHALFRNSTLVELKAQGHFPFGGTGASVCARHILPFLDRRS